MDLISQLRYQAQRDAEAAAAAAPAESPDPLARFRLDGKVAVVTGGAGGIGRQCALEFAAVGATVVIVDRDGADLDGAARNITDQVEGATVATAAVDVASKAAVDALAAKVAADFGSIDVWVNAAGVLRYQPFVEIDQDHFDTVVGVNLQGVLWSTAAAGRQMVKQGSGSIVNIASAGGDMPSPNIAIYGLTKAAVMHLTKTAAVELGPSGVRVNAIAPGFIDTPMVSVHWTDSAGNVDPEARKHMMNMRAAQSPMNATGEPRDIADAVLYLATDAARFVTGQVMRPNGGVVMP
ncbi:MAG: SDR family oxidoreductase [Acidimicrobiia bacterium]